LTYTLAGCRHILSKLRELPGSWYGRLRARDWGGLRLGFCASIHDLGDAGLAIIDMEGSPGGPLEIILVVPAGRRAKLRPDLAFEFVSFLRFLEGPESLGSEMAIHDYVERTLHEAGEPATLVFSIQTRFVLAEAQIPIAEQAEKLAMAITAWLAEKDARQGAAGTAG
jgi:hypothetical protein